MMLSIVVLALDCWVGYISIYSLYGFTVDESRYGLLCL